MCTVNPSQPPTESAEVVQFVTCLVRGYRWLPVWRHLHKPQSWSDCPIVLKSVWSYSPSAHAWQGPSSPHRHKWKFVSTRVFKVTFRHLPQPWEAKCKVFRNLRQLLKILKKNCILGWGRRGTRSFFCGLLIFLLLRDPCKIKIPRTNRPISLFPIS